jgi:hypothetical protein
MKLSCWVCGKEGHKSFQCEKRAKPTTDDSKANLANEECAKEEYLRLFMATEIAAAAQNRDRRCFDSACTSHIYDLQLGHPVSQTGNQLKHMMLQNGFLCP